MKISLKTILLTACATVATFVSVVYVSSCKKDKCKSVVCAHDGVCNSGNCICPTGYEGANCEIASRVKFVRNWTVTEDGSTTTPAQYTTTISNSNKITDVVITNFFNYFQANIAAHVAKDTIYIPNQQLEGKVVFGFGYIYSTVALGTNGSINMVYEVVDTATNIPDDFGYYAPDGSLASVWQ